MSPAISVGDTANIGIIEHEAPWRRPGESKERQNIPSVAEKPWQSGLPSGGHSVL